MWSSVAGLGAGGWGWWVIIRQRALQNVNIGLHHGTLLLHESSRVQRDGEGSQSPAAPIYSVSSSHSSPGVLKSSTFISTSHPQHPSLSLSLSLSLFFKHDPPLHFPFISFPLVLTQRRCMIYEALFLPVTEEKERGEAVTKRRG